MVLADVLPFFEYCVAADIRKPANNDPMRFPAGVRFDCFDLWPICWWLALPIRLGGAKFGTDSALLIVKAKLVFKTDRSQDRHLNCALVW